MKLIRCLKLLVPGAAVLGVAACAAVAPGQPEDMRYATLGPQETPVRLAYREHGKGKPILLIHGFGANAYTWRHLVPALAQTHKVITIDLKGFGQSDKPLDEKYSVLDQAALVADFIERKKLNGVTLIGHSLGGGVALALALDKNAERRNRIERLVLLDTVAYAQKIPIAFNLLRAPIIGPVSTFLVPKELQARAALRIAYHDNSKFDSTDVAEYAGPLRDRGAQHALIRSARQIVPHNIDQLAARYPTITIPALVLWCNHDKVVKPHIGWRLHQDLPNSTFKIIKGCGHIPQEERPQETVEAILGFLSRH